MAVDEELKRARHSMAHVMAEALLRLYPDAKTAIGPAIDTGFYYDFDFPTAKPSEADFPEIEHEMRRILSENRTFTRREVSRDEALAMFKDQPYKRELIEGLAEGEAISVYDQGGFVDLCRGPHVESTRQLNAQGFKITSTAGAYWRGDVSRPMLTRIYAVYFAKPAELKAYLAMIAEAEKRDHRKLAVQLDLFHIDAEDPGQIFWHPNGWTVYTTLQQYMREKILADGYQEVNTPAVMPKSLWERSGHWGHYQANMFITESEKKTFAIKPMNCPGALQIFNSRLRSYRELPLRLAEIGNCVRNEPSGTLHGIMRVRGFVQDDAHIICTEEQIEGEVAKFCRLLLDVYKDFGFDEHLIVKLSTMPEDHVGELETWQRAQAALAAACNAAGISYEVQPGEGAFYGPKLEFTLTDALGRQWQCGTIQLDYQLPSSERLDAQYVGADNQKHHPVMLHRAVLGSMERFLGILIENYAGAFPTWLAFEQVAVVPVADEFDEYARSVTATLKAAGIRAVSYTGGGNMKAKIKIASAERKTPYILIVGAKEQEEGTVTCRFRLSSKIPQRTFSLDEFTAYVQEKIRTHYNGI